MNRREFVQTAGAGVAGAAFFSTGIAGLASASSMKKTSLKKVVKFGMIQEDMSILDKFKLLKRLGFDGVEMDSPTDLDIDEIVAAKDESGLPIPGVVDSVHWNKTLSSADSLNFPSTPNGVDAKLHRV